jgi:hypothetical protein
MDNFTRGSSYNGIFAKCLQVSGIIERECTCKEGHKQGEEQWYKDSSNSIRHGCYIYNPKKGAKLISQLKNVEEEEYGHYPSKKNTLKEVFPTPGHARQEGS